jgi:hypothetical protein
MNADHHLTHTFATALKQNPFWQKVSDTEEVANK